MIRIFLSLICFVLSTSVWASKARLEALGQHLQGSYYIDDTRNIFINPASINLFKDYISLEWGSRGGAAAEEILGKGVAGSHDEADSSASAKAEGGVIRSVGHFVWGVYLGNEDESAFLNRARVDQKLNTVSSSTTETESFLEEDNRLDFFFGGNAGTLWGLNFSYSANTDEQNNGVDKEQSSLGIKMGFATSSIDVYGHYVLRDKAEGAKTSADFYDDDGSFLLGTGYKWANYKLFLEYESQSFSGEYDGTSRDGKVSKILCGLSQVQKLTEKAVFSWSLQFQNESLDLDDGDFERRMIPLTFSIESEVKDWLTLRGSVTQMVMSSFEDENGKSASVANSTQVSAGLTFSFNRMQVDGMIGTERDSAGNESHTGHFKTDELLSRVSMTYWF